jgi:hypothetical protein
MAADAWELRTARLEGAYEQVDRRLGAVEGRLATLEHKMDTGFAQVRAEIGALRDALHVEISGLRNALHAEISGLRDALHAEISGIQDASHAEISGLRDVLHAEISGFQDASHAEISGLRDVLHAEMRRQFYWLLGVMLSGFLAIGLKIASH